MGLFLSYNHIKLKLGVFLTGYTVAMLTCYVKEIGPYTWKPMIRDSFNATIVVAAYCGCSYDSSN